MKTGEKNRRRWGFTLIELLTVMAIMGLLTTVAITSYFAAVRGMARRSALKHLASTLMLARQRACMEGRQMSVFIYGELVTTSGDEDATSSTVVIPTYMVCRRLGRVSSRNTIGGKTILIDEFGGLDKIFQPVFENADIAEVNYSKFLDEHAYETMRLYNLDRGGWSDVYTRVLYAPLKDRYSATRNAGNTQDEEDYKYKIPAYGFIVKNELSGDWHIGNAYGFEAEAPNTLPTGFEFKDIKDENDIVLVTFRPDGTAVKGRNIEIREAGAGSKAKSATISVKDNGVIEWDQSAGAWK